MAALWKWFLNLFVNNPGSVVEKAPPVVVSPKPTAPPADNIQPLGLEYYPKAVRYGKMRERGPYKGGYPKGAVVHFTAGRYEGGVVKAKDSIDGGIENGYTFLCIGNDGSVVQAHRISQWGYHAGNSAWKGLTDTVSDELIGIEINCAGLLTKLKDGRFQTWFKTYIPADQVRYVTEKEYGCPTGYYHKFTPAQEAALIDLLVWLKKNDKTGNFNVKYILGHHEVSGLKGIGRWRKNDPGGSLSMSMDQLRQKIASLV